MARPHPAEFDKQKTVAENRRARFDYYIDDKLEAGICLTGIKVKSLRFGNRFNHEPKRPRQLQLREHG